MSRITSALVIVGFLVVPSLSFAFPTLNDMAKFTVNSNFDKPETGMFQLEFTSYDAEKDLLELAQRSQTGNGPVDEVKEWVAKDDFMNDEQLDAFLESCKDM